MNLVLGEPVFESSVLPWHNLYFARWKDSVRHLLVDGATKILPSKAHLYAMAIELKDLWKIRAPVKSTQGINLAVFDELIKVSHKVHFLGVISPTSTNSQHIRYFPQGAIDCSDAQIEPHPLWEYPSRALSSAVQVMSVDLTTLSEDSAKMIVVNGIIETSVAGNCNGIALWMDWQLDECTSIGGGPTLPVTIGQNVHWDMHSKQAVYFLNRPVNLSDGDKKVLKYQISLVPETYELKFNFSIQ